MPLLMPEREKRTITKKVVDGLATTPDFIRTQKKVITSVITGDIAASAAFAGDKITAIVAGFATATVIYSDYRDRRRSRRDTTNNADITKAFNDGIQMGMTIGTQVGMGDIFIFGDGDQGQSTENKKPHAPQTYIEGTVVRPEPEENPNS
jgi:hypothetical protein